MVIDTHVHVFAEDQSQFPYHKNASYRPPPAPIEEYIERMDEISIDRAVLVHPEPYQSDHRYLLYCLKKYPERLKGTCLFDPESPNSPRALRELVQKQPRIIALRIHAYHPDKIPSILSVPVRTIWQRAGALGLVIQMHIVPRYARDVEELVKAYSDIHVLIDHLGRPAQGDEEEYKYVLGLAQFDNVYMKLSGVRYISKEPFPHQDAKPLVRQVVETFGSERMIWGGGNPAIVEALLDFLPESERKKVLGDTAAKLFGF
ncbi:TPA: amidohydrolase [Candidatus Poribacteria bacterium]|nr:amidohydrolase [Candidatus Poribacteria bacterium]